MKKIYIYLIYIFGVSSAHATSVLYQNFEQLIDNSHHAVGGVIAELIAKKYPDGNIYTTVILKDAYTIESGGIFSMESKINIRYQGGTIEEKNLRGEVIGADIYELVGTPVLEKGENVILFISHNGVANMPIHGWGQGVFRIDAANGINDEQGNPVVGFSGADIITNTHSGLMSRNQLISQVSIQVDTYQQQTDLSIIASDGGADNNISEVSQSPKQRQGSTNLLPIDVSNFISMIQERKSITSSILQPQGSPLNSSPRSSLTTLPPIASTGGEFAVDHVDDISSPDTTSVSTTEPTREKKNEK